MKYKKLILTLLFIIAFVYIGHTMIEESFAKKYNDKLIRFHIRANSDNEEDQNLKLKIRDEILEEMEEKFSDTKSLNESRNIIKENMDKMKEITEKVIDREGKDYEVAVTLGQDKFPTRKYGDLVLPAGDYETLLITIGEGKGQNWWCVMFPPLCFVDITHSVAYNVEEDIEKVTIEPYYEETKNKLGKEEPLEEKEENEEEPKLKLKWKVGELFKQLTENN